MNRRIGMFFVTAWMFAALAQEQHGQQAETQNADQSAELSKVEKQVKSIRTEAKQLQSDITDVDDVEAKINRLDKRLEGVKQDKKVPEGTETAQQLTEARQEIEEARRKLKRAEEQKKWHLESRVTTADPIYFVWDIDRFNEILDENDLVVVYFYELPKEQMKTIEEDGIEKRTERWYTVDKQGVSFASVAKNDEYQRAGVAFVMANLSKDEMARLKKQHNLDAKDTIMVFENGVPYTDKKLTGPFDTHEIRKFVRKYIDDLVEERIKEMERRAKKRERERTEVRYVYDDYDRPRFSVGFGYGPYYDPYHYGYPYRYRRHHYGHPHFGWRFGW